MAFYQYTGDPRYYDGIFLLATNLGVADFGTNTPPQDGRWTSNAGPATIFSYTGGPVGPSAVPPPYFKGRWLPLTVYNLGDNVITPSNVLGTAIVAFTSGTVYNPANWAVSPSGGGMPIPGAVLPAWSASTTYSLPGQLITYGGYIQSNIAAHTSGAVFPGASVWVQLGAALATADGSAPAAASAIVLSADSTGVKSIVQGTNIAVTILSNWGVNAQGNGYHDPAGASIGDGASFGTDIYGNLILTRIIGA